jgi:hypothetical protein
LTVGKNLKPKGGMFDEQICNLDVEEEFGFGYIDNFWLEKILSCPNGSIRVPE